mmetsp:Transcript_1670/g.2492  ORF Transcript_1670/g.2492 Transcript_1670/m.2492 type:complete len:243 (-) Transcript_1670:162-890(-)
MRKLCSNLISVNCCHIHGPKPNIRTRPSSETRRFSSETAFFVPDTRYKYVISSSSPSPSLPPPSLSSLKESISPTCPKSSVPRNAALITFPNFHVKSSSKNSTQSPAIYLGSPSSRSLIIVSQISAMDGVKSESTLAINSSVCRSATFRIILIIVSRLTGAPSYSSSISSITLSRLSFQKSDDRNVCVLLDVFRALDIKSSSVLIPDLINLRFCSASRAAMRAFFCSALLLPAGPPLPAPPM